MVHLCRVGVATSMTERTLYNTVEPPATVKRRQTNLKNGEKICQKARVLDIGDNIIIPIPVVDKRSPFDPPNLAGVITGNSEDGYYNIATVSGTLERGYLSTEIELSFSKLCYCLTPTSNPFLFTRKEQTIL